MGGVSGMNEKKFFNKIDIKLKKYKKYNSDITIMMINLNKDMLIMMINLICTSLIITGNIAYAEIKNAIKLIENITDKTWKEIIEIWEECQE